MGKLLGFGVCTVYAMCSGLMTLTTKMIYKKFSNLKSPANILCGQFIISLPILFTIMIIKQFRPQSFKSLEAIKFSVSSASDSLSRAKYGIRVGLLQVTTTAFGVYATKQINIPMFLANRRCALFSTVVLMYLIQNKKPS